jgi:predicted GNAT family acetyltransferase
MEIKKTNLKEVSEKFGELKPDLLDECAIYYGAYIKEELVGIVSYVEHPNTIYLCHAYVNEEHRNRGVYKLLWEYRNMKVKELGKTITAHCNVSSLKHFLDNGYKIEKALFKVYK